MSPTPSLRALYDLWAPSYLPAPHNPLMRVEQTAMLRLLPPLAGLRALDLACGTGRYTRILAAHGAAAITSLDFSMAMLKGARGDGTSRRRFSFFRSGARGEVPSPRRKFSLLPSPNGRGAGGCPVPAQFAGGGSTAAHRVKGELISPVCASMLDLPLPAAAFDLVVSGLAVGHAPDLQRWLAEAARVLRPGGSLLYSDFHPFAKQAGWQRTFRDPGGATRAVPFHAHAPAAHAAAARALGLRLDVLEELRVGVELTEAFPGSRDFYRRWRGKPIILVARMTRE